MNMRQNLMDIYKILTTDETLLRLLYYKPTSLDDSPLDVSKANILSMSDADKWAIINDRILWMPKTSDLTDKALCRICYYHGKRRTDRSNYMGAAQEVIVDIIVHISFEQVSMRMAEISDRINDLFFDKKITGTKDVMNNDGAPIQCPSGFVGYRFIFNVGGVN